MILQPLNWRYLSWQFLKAYKRPKVTEHTLFSNKWMHKATGESLNVCPNETSKQGSEMKWLASKKGRCEMVDYLWGMQGIVHRKFVQNDWQTLLPSLQPVIVQHGQPLQRRKWSHDTHFCVDNVNIAGTWFDLPPQLKTRV